MVQLPSVPVETRIRYVPRRTGRPTNRGELPRHERGPRHVLSDTVALSPCPCDQGGTSPRITPPCGAFVQVLSALQWKGNLYHRILLTDLSQPNPWSWVNGPSQRCSRVPSFPRASSLPMRTLQRFPRRALSTLSARGPSRIAHTRRYYRVRLAKRRQRCVPWRAAVHRGLCTLTLGSVGLSSLVPRRNYSGPRIERIGLDRFLHIFQFCRSLDNCRSYPPPHEYFPPTPSSSG